MEGEGTASACLFIAWFAAANSSPLGRNVFVLGCICFYTSRFFMFVLPFSPYKVINSFENRPFGYVL